jgi:hypothetical protein
MEGSSPVTHNVYTTGSGGGMGDGASSSSGLHAMIPALMAMGMGNQGKTEHHHHHMQPGTTQDNSALHAISGLAAGAGLGRGTGYGAGLGGMGAAAGGVVGLIIGALLSGNGGFFGGNRNGNDGNLVTTTELQSALNAQTANSNTNSILQSLATIQQIIPEAEGRSQLALAQAQLAIQNQVNQGQIANLQSFAQQTASIVEARKDVNDNVHLGRSENAANFSQAQLQMSGYNSATQLGIANLGLQAANNTNLIITSVRDDGDKTRALLTAFNDATLNRIITTQANEIIELRNDRLVRGNGVEITQTVNQAQANNQQQQQSQQQLLLLSQISSQLAAVHQVANATNQNIIAGNSGAVTTGYQTANPTNINT